MITKEIVIYYEATAVCLICPPSQWVAYKILESIRGVLDIKNPDRLPITVGWR